MGISTIKISIVDDHPLVINGIKQLLSRYTHLDLIASYNDGVELLEGLKFKSPDILLLDIKMPGADGEELIDLLNKDYAHIKVIALTGYDTPYYVQTMLKKGCKGYLLKSSGEQELIQAIEAVYQGNEFIEKTLQEDLLLTMIKEGPQNFNTKAKLTKREKDILKLIMEEKTSQEIADTLFLSLRTIEKYRLNLLQKMKVKNTVGLVIAALKLNLV